MGEMFFWSIIILLLTIGYSCSEKESNEITKQYYRHESCLVNYFDFKAFSKLNTKERESFILKNCEVNNG